MRKSAERTRHAGGYERHLAFVRRSRAARKGWDTRRRNERREQREVARVERERAEVTRSAKRAGLRVVDDWESEDYAAVEWEFYVSYMGDD